MRTAGPRFVCLAKEGVPNPDNPYSKDLLTLTFHHVNFEKHQSPSRQDNRRHFTHDKTVVYRRCSSPSRFRPLDAPPFGFFQTEATPIPQVCRTGVLRIKVHHAPAAKMPPLLAVFAVSSSFLAWRHAWPRCRRTPCPRRLSTPRRCSTCQARHNRWCYHTRRVGRLARRMWKWPDRVR